MVRRKTKGKVIRIPVDSIRHKDRRVNIPTEELRDFVIEEGTGPRTMLYPRDPSLDPQLVWKGKDEQDREDLAVPVVPIYIQEKIHPQAIIEDLREQARKKQPDNQPSLFADFNGIEFEKLIEFYQHEQKWTNRMILGDSLLAMTSLAEKENLKGQVQMIYFDPPYGIKFGSNWQVSTRNPTMRDAKPEDVTRQPEQVRAFRDTWRLGIHSYLSYLRDRLIVARDLLAESGSIFVQIGDENVHLVRCILDEVFGRHNFISQITFVKTGGFSSTYLKGACDYILWYAKNAEQVKVRQLLGLKVEGAPRAEKYDKAQLPSGERKNVADAQAQYGELPVGARVYREDNLTSQGNPVIPFEFEGQTFAQPWKTNSDGMRRLMAAGRIVRQRNRLAYVRFLDDFPAYEHTNVWTDIGGIQSRSDPKIYVVQTATEAIKRCMLLSTDPGDLVLDPTCGSGTTAYVAEQWGRRWITIDTSRVALALARIRLMTAKFPYYILADSAEGTLKEAEITGRVPPNPMPKCEQDIRKGFVYKRVPHITLKSIANNAEIDEIYARWQQKQEPIRAELNRLLGQAWEEWEIPREPDESWLDKAKQLLAQWWELRCERQREIDVSIARNGDYELLYDQPYEDPNRIRVTGPFTVESLSPYRVLQADKDLPESETAALKDASTGQFTEIILDHLRKAGIQNTKKGERLTFDRLEPYAGTWIHAVGEYADAEGKTRRVAVTIGPEHGTVGPELIKEAAKEAVQGIGFDILAVCGFAFDPHVSEEAKRYGKLNVLIVRMNPDLMMSDLLKNTGSGNLFMVFGEPDMEVQYTKDSKIVVELKGVDVYDPTTGEVRNSSVDDIACWFIDTDYNGESFFVRHAYFLGGNEPYDKLKRALRAEIHEDAWAALYSAESRPFDPPKTGKIAVKVINHYGDEVLKVYTLSTLEHAASDK